MTLTEIIKQMDGTEKTKEEQLQTLRKLRSQVLEEIHCKQQILD